MSKRIMEGFKELTRVDDALAILFREVTHVPEVVEVDLEDSVGLPVAEDITSPTDFPPFNRSAVDGYAVRSFDTLGASMLNPIELKVAYEVIPGFDISTLRPLEPGEAAIIYTGAPLPPGADAVVMAEDARRQGDKVYIMAQVTPFQNVSRKGEDFSRGKIVIRKGDKLMPWHIGALASLGITKVKVYRRLRVGVLSTGSELVELREVDKGSPPPGKIVDSTKTMLKALLGRDGYEAVDLGVVPDDMNAIEKAIARSIGSLDAIITTGGTSIGSYDLVPEAVNRLGRVLFNGVRMRPGKPTGAGVVEGKPIFMLSGFPVASLAGYLAFVRPVLRRMTGTPEDPMPIAKGVITRRVANIAGVRTYLRVRVYRSEGRYKVEPLAITASGVLSTLTDANGILVIPEDVEGYDEGDEVEVLLIAPLT